jgi:ATP-dependent Clp protease adaptor protein ClpS
MVLEAPVLVPEQETKEETRRAPQWKVLLINDDITTFEFVIWLLMDLFAKPYEEAVRLTFEVHETGAGLVTVTNQERAELYVEQVHSLARARGFPLQSAIEPA